MTAGAGVKDWRRPYVTAAFVLLTVVAGVAQVVIPGYADAMQRDPHGLSLQGAWRVVSALLVQTDGPVQFALNVAMLTVIGAYAEQALSRTRWVVVYVVAGVIGQLLGYAWEPAGGGNSVAVFGLGGAVLVAVMSDALPPVAAAVVVVLAGVQLGFTTVGVAGAVVAAVVLSQVARFSLVRRPAAAPRFLALTGLALGVALFVLRDHHGASLLVGALITRSGPIAASGPASAVPGDQL